MTVRKVWLGDLFTCTVLFLYTGAFITIFIGSHSAEEAFRGTTMMQLLWSSISVVALVRAIPIRHRIIAVLEKNLALVALLSLTSISFCWSIDSQLTARRSLALLLATIFAIDFGIRYSVAKQIRLVSVTVGAAVILSAIVALFFPSAVPPADTGFISSDPVGWNGLFNHKSVFGHILTFAVLCTLLHLRENVRSTVRCVICLAVIFSLIAESQSRTALVISTILVLQWFFLKMMHWNVRTLRTLGVATALLTLLLIAASLPSSGGLASMIDRSTDLTGRTEVWKMVLDSASKKPVLGYGYSGFWELTYESKRISNLLNWSVPTAHNSFLDVYIQVGMVGLLLLMSSTAVGIVRSFRFARRYSTPESAWPLSCILLVLYYSATESYFLTSNSFTWTMFVSALVSTSFPTPLYPLPRKGSTQENDITRIERKESIEAYA